MIVVVKSCLFVLLVCTVHVQQARSSSNAGGRKKSQSSSIIYIIGRRGYVRGGKKVCAYNMCLKLYLLCVQLYKLLLLESVSEYKYILPSVKTSYRNKNRCKNKTKLREMFRCEGNLLQRKCFDVKCYSLVHVSL